MAKNQGAQAFDEFFAEIYADRWPALSNALLLDDRKVARGNRFFTESLEGDLAEFGVGAPHAFLIDCYEIKENFDLTRFSSHLLPFYRMDPASVVAARALECQPGEKVLDMCAAPGGKSLVLLEDLMLSQGELDLSGHFTANEMSAKRRFRMMSVFKRYVPKEVRARVQIKGVDGSLIGVRTKEEYDRILLDAPCSGERGVVQKASDLAQWKPKRSKSFAIRQYALLSSAFMALKPGGTLVYSTCSISPLENDEVLNKLKKRKPGEFEVVTLKAQGPSEPTEWGRQFLPDQQGWGPIFYAKILKT